MQIVPAWPPVACNMNKIHRNLHATGGHAGKNLHATGGHSSTICLRLVAARLQDKRQKVKSELRLCTANNLLFMYYQK
jgi:hypothetical protein